MEVGSRLELLQIVLAPLAPVEDDDDERDGQADADEAQGAGIQVNLMLT